MYKTIHYQASRVDRSDDSAADATEDVADESGGGGLDKLKETASDVWETVKPKDTTRPGLQLVLGGVGGGIGNFADDVQQHKSIWTLVGDTFLGAGTGALGNLGGNTAFSPFFIGFGAGAANPLRGDGINNHSLTGMDFAWAGLTAPWAVGRTRSRAACRAQVR